MKNILNKIIERAQLDKAEAYQCMLAIGNGELPDAQTVAIMAGIQMRGLQLDELIGFRQALLELALPMRLDIALMFAEQAATARTPLIFLLLQHLYWQQ
jgi:anthranilate phosphoribosyltransferase